MPVKREAKREENKDIGRKVGEALGGIFSGLTEIVERLGELAEKGEELSKAGNIEWESKEGKNLKGVYGFSIKTGLGGQGYRVEPFGNVRNVQGDKRTRRTVVQEVREPMVDLFEEKDYTLILAEMPGVDEKDIRVDVKGDILTIAADSGDKKYRKEVLLPKEYPRERISVSSKNGIVEIRCSD